MNLSSSVGNSDRAMQSLVVLLNEAVHVVPCQGGVGIETKELGLNFLLTGSRLKQPANVIRHISNLGNDDVI